MTKPQPKLAVITQDKFGYHVTFRGRPRGDMIPMDFRTDSRERALGYAHTWAKQVIDRTQP